MTAQQQSRPDVDHRSIAPRRRRQDDLDAHQTAAVVDDLEPSPARSLHLFAHDVGGTVSALRGIVDSVGRGNADVMTNHGRELLSRAHLHLDELQRLLDAVSARAAQGPSKGVQSFHVDLAAELDDLIGRVHVGGRTLVVELDRGTGIVEVPELSRAFEQLLVNAVNHTPFDARIWVNLRLMQGEAELVVADDGRGVPAPLREVIFAPAERGLAPPSVAGHGLGLYLARQVVEEAGGTLVCEEREGGGAVFRLRVPHRRVPDAP